MPEIRKQKDIRDDVRRKSGQCWNATTIREVEELQEYFDGIARYVKAHADVYFRQEHGPEFLMSVKYSLCVNHTSLGLRRKQLTN